MNNIINLPDFVFDNVDIKNISKFKKIKLLFTGFLFILVFKFSTGNIFCFFINLFYSKNGKIFFKENLYFKNIDGKNFYYPNKRITRIAIDHKQMLKKLYKTYCLDELIIENGDTILDCGANVGELYKYLSSQEISFRYIAFEPDKDAFLCLKKNTEGCILNNFALGNKNVEMELFYDTQGANTSLVDFGSDKYEKIQVKKLDSLNLTNIKLFKIDAEGFEPEVLDGAKETLKEISYIAIDYGNERGVDEDSTMVEVLNLLYENNFTLIKDSKYRKVGLFRNNSFSKWTSHMYLPVEEKKV